MLRPGSPSLCTGKYLGHVPHPRAEPIRPARAPELASFFDPASCFDPTKARSYLLGPASGNATQHLGRAFSGWGVGALAPTNRNSALWSTAALPPRCCLGFGRPNGSSWPVTISATTALSSDWPAGGETLHESLQRPGNRHEIARLCTSQSQVLASDLVPAADIGHAWQKLAMLYEVPTGHAASTQKLLFLL